MSENTQATTDSPANAAGCSEVKGNSMGARIGDVCWWNHIVLKEGVNEWRHGWLRAWSLDFEELRDGVGQFPVALIEDVTGRIRSVPAHLVTFAIDKPGV